MADGALKLRIPSHDYFPAQYSVCSAFRIAAKWVKDRLSPTQKDRFRELPWGHLIDIPQTDNSGQILHMLALHIVQDQPDNELWFGIGGTLYKFTYADFSYISELPIHDEPEAAEADLAAPEDEDCGDDSGQQSGQEDEPVGALAEKYFGGKDNITHANMKNIFTKLKPSKRGDDAVKLASLFYIECVLLAKDNTTRINASSVRLANDLEAFGKCPWSLQSYKILVKHMKDLMQDQPDKFQERKKKNPKYKNAKLSVYGFPLVLQVWAYEEIPEVGTHFANKVGNHDVPLLNWTAVPKFHYSKLRRLVFPEEEEKVSDSEEGEEEDETNEEDVQVFGKLKILEEMQNLRVCVEKVEKKITIVEDSISEIKVLLQKLIGNQNPSVQEEVDKVDNDDVIVQDEAAVEAEGENIVQTSDGEDAEVIHADAGQGEGQGPAADVPLKSTSVHEEGAAADGHGVAYRQLSPTADFTAHEDGVVKEVGDVSNPLKNEGGTRADLIISHY
ncbi:unnamed protein product [Cuscuta epithymum]|uniref:DUF1985 domain-containing protein n=1 Tax=Cuscuta epithymum TaxID=186058 RepID=A0AAV0E9L5_9ASTE|nr:unnamed protein product [Cuscuta epithymum]CAH9144556.1 unnamed protein product [Cuscuta epithymum]